MGEIFIPLSKTVKELFDGNNYYQVPSYQRPYRWKTENVEELWEDLTNAIENDDEEYFLGSIILTKNKSNKYLDVIDGQQRLTTLTILFCVLRDIYYNQIEDKKTKNTILGRIKSLETDNERLRFKTQSQKQNSFEQEILKEINFNKKRNKSEIQSDSFLNTAYLFKDKIETLLDEDPKKIEEFTDYVLDKVRIITIECTTQSLAIKLFQVLNIRGMDLTPADLIKSYLMSKLKEDDWDSFEHTWTEIETLSNELGENLTELFTYYEYYLLASNPKRALYVELEKQFKNRDAKEIIYEFKKLISYFVEIDTENSKIIHGLNYLRHDVFWKSILLSAKMENWEQQDFNQLASLLRKFYYLYWIAGYTTTKTKQTSFNVISWIKSKKYYIY